MTEDYTPLEESQEVADAVADDVAVAAFITGGGPDADNPQFQQPGEDRPDADQLDADQPVGGRPDEEATIRTGADQPWDPEDLAVAEGRDPTPENIERARRELEDDGAAAIERTVP